MRRLVKRGIPILLLCYLVVGCSNFKVVNEYAMSSLKEINTFQEKNYTFRQYCIDQCKLNAVDHFDINRQLDCDCTPYQQADTAVSLLQNAIQSYLGNLLKLSNATLTDYDFGGLRSALAEGNFGAVTITKEQADAYTLLSKLLLRMAANHYQKKHIKMYIQEANAPLHVLMEKLQFIIKNDLLNELNFKKERRYYYYKKLNLSHSLSEYEKGKATMEYYDELDEINQQQHQMYRFALMLNVIAKGHQKLYDHRDRLKTKMTFKEFVKTYNKDIQDITNDINDFIE